MGLYLSYCYDLSLEWGCICPIVMTWAWNGVVFSHVSICLSLLHEILQNLDVSHFPTVHLYYEEPRHDLSYLCETQYAFCMKMMVFLTPYT